MLGAGRVSRLGVNESVQLLDGMGESSTSPRGIAHNQLKRTCLSVDSNRYRPELPIMQVNLTRASV